MKSENNLLFTIAGLLSLFSSVAIADTSFAEQKNNGAAPEISQALALEKMIQKNTEQKFAVEDKKYTQIVALAGNRQNELAKRKSEVTNAYQIWQDAKSAVEQSRNANSAGFKAIEVAAQSYSQANKAFIDLQKDILAKNGVSSDLIVAFNAAPPTAAGSRQSPK